MNENEFVDMLKDAIFEADVFFDADIEVATFEEAMVMTTNEGLVVQYGNKTFQLTVVEA